MKRQWDVFANDIFKILLINIYFLSYGILLAYSMAELDTQDHSKDRAIWMSIFKKKIIKTAIYVLQQELHPVPLVYFPQAHSPQD